jgi:exopolyphosphatase/guanosine-5'-triphosphate,3'-diphosphate pyrophosphatase
VGGRNRESQLVNAKDRLDEAGLLDLPEPHYRSRRRLDRLGVVDVGSNSVRLVVFDGAARSPAYFFNEKILCGLGAGVAETGRLNPEGRARALVALKRFALLAENMECEPLYCVATAAVREAADGPDFIRQVRKESGLDLVVASGAEEARLSAQGVLLGWPDAEGLMCDIGGSSMELAEITAGKVGRCVTSPLGPLKLSGFEKKGALEDEIARILDGLSQTLPSDPGTLFLVGGSWRAIARLDMERRSYPLKVLHEYTMTPDGLAETVDWIGKHTVEEMRAISGSSIERMRLVPIAARVLRQLVRTFRPKVIAVSSYGIREGLLYEQMSEGLKRRDPLIEACLYMERASARNPGFGEVLYEFLEPLFKTEDKPRKRLIRAACLLHDVTWRAHPDYRAEVCFDNATRANLGGLDHAGRVFLGLSLLHRYKNTAGGSALAAVTTLLTEDERRMAQIVGKAMRFGAMLSGASRSMSCSLKHHKKQAVIELVMRPRARDLFGEVVKTRFESLASSMNCTTMVTVA